MLRVCRPADALGVGVGFIVTSPQGGSLFALRGRLCPLFL